MVVFVILSVPRTTTWRGILCSNIACCVHMYSTSVQEGFSPNKYVWPFPGIEHVSLLHFKLNVKIEQYMYYYDYEDGMMLCINRVPPSNFINARGLQKKIRGLFAASDTSTSSTRTPLSGGRLVCFRPSTLTPKNKRVSNSMTRSELTLLLLNYTVRTDTDRNSKSEWSKTKRLCDNRKDARSKKLMKNESREAEDERREDERREAEKTRAEKTGLEDSAQDDSA
jgi:hypothetical protein